MYGLGMYGKGHERFLDSGLLMPRRKLIYVDIGCVRLCATATSFWLVVHGPASLVERWWKGSSKEELGDESGGAVRESFNKHERQDGTLYTNRVLFTRDEISNMRAAAAAVCLSCAASRTGCGRLGPGRMTTFVRAALWALLNFVISQAYAPNPPFVKSKLTATTCQLTYSPQGKHEVIESINELIDEMDNIQVGRRGQ